MMMTCCAQVLCARPDVSSRARSSPRRPTEHAVLNTVPQPTRTRSQPEWELEQPPQTSIALTAFYGKCITIQADAQALANGDAGRPPESGWWGKCLRGGVQHRLLESDK